MPWSELKPMDQRILFIADHLKGCESMSALCARYGVSRKTGYKWLERYEAAGPGGLAEHNRRRHEQERIPYAIRQAILELRTQGGLEQGPKKIQKLLEARYGAQAVPSRTTIYNVLKQAGRIAPRRVRRRVVEHEGVLRSTREPNALWSADYKGQFQTGDHRWCYPLTVMDHASRYLLACKGLEGPQLAPTRAVFEQLFRRYGLPDRLRTDNGAPFASTGSGGLSRLSIWWLKLGILPERIEPGHPEQNGRHERMHRTLKRATAQPPAATLRAQQRRMDEFRRFYNGERLHEALDQCTPQSCYTKSTRPYPSRLDEMSYAGYIQPHRVTQAGLIYQSGKIVYVGHLLHGEVVGLEPVDDGVWRVYFGPIALGLIDERKAKQHYLTIKVLPM
ncbi:integrase core domain-containing protein [Ralstonia pseudosolanacearum]|uniref:integrase core domain-containing protein n=1 Tax=Ralstonia pseudosolanacearum TaxID=1310165 RepID=UPI0018D1A3A1|nr:integrase core domain-containing protein [Ralstonia pseudosolanacearum]